MSSYYYLTKDNRWYRTTSETMMENAVADGYSLMFSVEGDEAHLREVGLKSELLPRSFIKGVKE